MLMLCNPEGEITWFSSKVNIISCIVTNAFQHWPIYLYIHTHSQHCHKFCTKWCMYLHMGKSSNLFKTWLPQFVENRMDISTSRTSSDGKVTKMKAARALMVKNSWFVSEHHLNNHKKFSLSIFYQDFYNINNHAMDSRINQN